MAYLFDKRETVTVECSYFVGQVTFDEWRAEWPEFVVGNQRGGSGAVADSKWGTQGHVVPQLRPVLVLFPDPLRKWKGGSGKQTGVQVYTVEC